jgi:hypothetical protein
LSTEAAPKSIPEAEKIKLWTRAGGRCELCNKYLLEDEFTAQPVSLAELAHNVGRQKAAGSPRGLADLPVKERNKSENLLLLCGDHHRVIDDRIARGEYTVEQLRDLKQRHEERIRYLTELREDVETVVLRAIGTIRSAPVELSAETVRRSVAAAGRYPRYDLAARGGDIELDLRSLPDEGSEEYWHHVGKRVDDLRTRIHDGVARGVIRHISLFAAGRIPLLAYLGSKLDDKVPTDLYQKQRDGDEHWHWDETAPAVSFETVTTRTGANDSVALILSISGTVDIDRLPASTTDATIYTIQPAAGVVAGPDVFRNRASLDAFAATYRAFLAQLEVDHPGLAHVDVFPAIPLTAAVTLGRARMADAHPPLRIHDRNDDGGYAFALEIA